MQHTDALYLATFQAAAGAPAAEGLDPWQLVLDASPVVKAVMVLLVLMSVACWFIMGAKAVRVFQATRTSRQFLHRFWGGEDAQRWTPERLESLYAEIAGFKSSPIAAVFRAGYVELARVITATGALDATEGDMENVERSLRRTAGTELTQLETALPFLATTAATAPFIGLFGTVWGIMNSFIAIHGDASTSLDVVAPGIAEALIATAIGLAAAIPAVMAYNYFVRRIRVLESEMESFSYDYLNIVRRNFLKG